MILHYLKIAWRNLLKYRMQSFVNIFGLAVGFACFALSAMWMRYELSYDNYHEGADRIYLAYRISTTHTGGYDLQTTDVIPLLKENFPEVETVCGIRRTKNRELEVEGQVPIKVTGLVADTTFMNLFGIKVLSGDTDFLHNDRKIAITEETALRLYGKTDVIGKELRIFRKVTVGAIISALPHSNLTFDYWTSEGNKYLASSGNPLLIRLREDADIETLSRKLEAFRQIKDGKEAFPFKNIQWMPLTKYRCSKINTEQTVRFTYLLMFSTIGGLVIIVTLFNYLSLFVVRMRIRNREIQLRRVNGSSRRSLFLLFGTEYTALVLFAGLLGMVLVEIILPSFRSMSGISGTVYQEAFSFFLPVLLLSWLMLLPFIVRIRNICQTGRSFFRPFSIGLQMSVSIFFVFVTAVLMKQLYYLSNTDLGWERKNIASLLVVRMNDTENIFKNIAALRDDIARLSYVTQTMDNHWSLLAQPAIMRGEVTDWDGRHPDEAPIQMVMPQESGVFTDFYGMKLLEGHMMTPTDKRYAVINETAARMMAIRQPIGKHLTVKGKTLEIVGLLKDFHINAPTMPVQPMLFIGENGLGWKEEMAAMGFMDSHNGRILIKYQDGYYKELQKDLELLSQKHGLQRYDLERTEDLYQEYLQSEHLLLRLLAFVSTVCILVSAFGIFSMITLSCERRRKEVAIRKVNGARVGDILGLFAREYLLLLAAAAVVAFPVGYVLMKRWLESYVEQTPLSWWLYAVIFLGMALLVALCIGWRVWRAANENPAEVVKRE